MGTFGRRGTVTYYNGAEASGNANIVEIHVAQNDIDVGSVFNLPSFVGKMDDLRIYNRDLDADEAFQLFESGPGESRAGESRPVSPRAAGTTAWARIKTAL